MPQTEPAAGAETIFASPDLRIRLVRAATPASAVVVTFAPWRSVPSVEHRGFGEDFLGPAGFDAVHVTCASNAWYQYPEMPAAVERIREATRGHARLVTYGSSMGAFAALAFSAGLGAHQVLAISPQFSVDPAAVPFEPRWQEEGAAISWLHRIPEGLSHSAECVLVYDPMHLDSRHVALIEALRPVSHLRLPFAGHPAGTFLKEIGEAGRLVRRLLRQEAPLPELRRDLRRRRDGSATYWHEIARALLARGADRRALCAFGRAAELAPRKPDYPHARGHLAVRLGEHALAAESFAAVARLRPDRAEAHYNLARALERTGALPEALAAAEQACALAGTVGRHADLRDRIARRLGAAATRRGGAGPSAG